MAEMLEGDRRDAGRQACYILRFAFTVAQIVAGADKFFHLLTDWDKYLAPWIARIVHNGHAFMLAAGVVEIVAGSSSPSNRSSAVIWWRSGSQASSSIS